MAPPVSASSSTSKALANACMCLRKHNSNGLPVLGVISYLLFVGKILIEEDIVWREVIVSWYIGHMGPDQC